MFRIDMSVETENRLLFVRGWRKEELGVTANRFGVAFWGDGNILALEVTVSQHCEYTKNQ